MSNEAKEAARVLGAFLIGGILGAGLSLLLAPQSGKKTREDIARVAGKARHQAEDMTEEVTHTVKNVIGDAAKLLSDVIGQGKGLSEDVRKELLGIIEQGQKTFEQQKTKILKMVK